MLCLPTVPAEARRVWAAMAARPEWAEVQAPEAKAASAAMAAPIQVRPGSSRPWTGPTGFDRADHFHLGKREDE
jgi:lysozyme family protein